MNSNDNINNLDKIYNQGFIDGADELINRINKYLDNELEKIDDQRKIIEIKSFNEWKGIFSALANLKFKLNNGDFSENN